MANWKWTFAVSGQSAFPLDMLRYDACYPYSQEAVGAIDESLQRIDPRRERKVLLVSRVASPEAGRWSSFGWKVSDVRKERA